jgi:hypothetical protein
MTATTEKARVLHYEDAANGLDAIAKDLAQMIRRIDAFYLLLRPEWQHVLLHTVVCHLDDIEIEKIKRLADDIYQQGERAKDKDI